MSEKVWGTSRHSSYFILFPLAWAERCITKGGSGVRVLDDRPEGQGFKRCQADTVELLPFCAPVLCTVADPVLWTQPEKKICEKQRLLLLKSLRFSLRWLERCSEMPFCSTRSFWVTLHPLSARTTLAVLLKALGHQQAGNFFSIRISSCILNPRIICFFFLLW